MATTILCAAGRLERLAALGGAGFGRRVPGRRRGSRITGVDLRGYQQMRLVLQNGSPAGLAGATLTWRYSLDGGTSWADTYADVILDGVANQYYYGGWADIPDTLRQSIGVQLAMFGSNGNGSTPATILSIGVDVKNVGQTSAARLLPQQVLPAEKLAYSETTLRSFSPQDIADIAFAATPAPTVRNGSSYTLQLADNHRLVECANAGAITVTVPTDAAVAFPFGARIEDRSDRRRADHRRRRRHHAAAVLRQGSEDPLTVLHHRFDQAQHE